MEIAIVGLGKMGYNLALNIAESGHQVYGYNRSLQVVKQIEKEGVIGTDSIQNLMSQFTGRKIIWLMVPAGETVDEIISSVLPHLSSNDIIVDGGNSNYNDSVRRYETLQKNGVTFLDVGTSGGIKGARYGACMMIGGDVQAFRFAEPIFKDACVEGGYSYLGPSGAGHYAKMIHNGIEYGMLQALGEGFEILEHGPYDYDYRKVAHVWNNGSVIRGWLIELTEKAFIEDPKLEELKGIIDSSGEGLWTVEEALKLQIPIPVITDSLYARYRSKQQDTFSGKLIAGLRKQFGGHKVNKK